MGASAIRLVVAEIAAGAPPRELDEASRGVLLGRDTFSGRTIRSRTVDAAMTAIAVEIAKLKSPVIVHIRAVATSAVREARNGDMFLDRIEGRTGIAFETINEAEESRLIFLAVRESLRRDEAFRGARTLLVEVGGARPGSRRHHVSRGVAKPVTHI